jgi:hypothetical protein
VKREVEAACGADEDADGDANAAQVTGWGVGATRGLGGGARTCNRRGVGWSNHMNHRTGQ